jgi:hypothetical protein
MQMIKTDRGIISGRRHYPRCRCGDLKVWYRVEVNCKVVHESAVCPVCDEARVCSLAIGGGIETKILHKGE